MQPSNCAFLEAFSKFVFCFSQLDHARVNQDNNFIDVNTTFEEIRALHIPQGDQRITCSSSGKDATTSSGNILLHKHKDRPPQFLQ